MARLLLLGLVTGVESYFRGVLARVLRVCPICRAAAAEQVIPFGAVEYYGRGDIESALFEGSSFSSVREVRNRTQKVLGIVVPSTGSLSEALDAFELVCELRHASVHAHGALTSANARTLRLPSELVPGTVQLDLAALHSLASACLAAVRAYNGYLFAQIVERWVSQRALSGEWATDWRSFRSLHVLFYSVEDRIGEPDAKKAYRPVQTAIHARLAKR